MTRRETVDHKMLGEASSIAPEQLNGQSPEIVRTYISGQIYESAFLPSGEKRGGRNIYNVLLFSASSPASATAFYFSFSSRPKLCCQLSLSLSRSCALPVLKRIAAIFWCEIYTPLRYVPR